MTVVVWALIGYAFGSFPSAWLVAIATRKRHVLLLVRRTAGEADAHVLLQRSGGRAATVAAALDVAKGFAPVMLAMHLTGSYEIAGCAVGTVTGHCWPPFFYRYAGRGLAAAAGASLAFLPLEMVIAGVVRVVGSLAKAGGLASTIGYMSIPVIAALRGQPLPFVVGAAAINALVFVRRLEGIRDDITPGVTIVRAVYRRAVLDSSPFVRSTSRREPASGP